MDSPHQMRLLQRRLEQARAEADEMAQVADNLANSLAAALNKLLPHDPDFVATFTGGSPEPEEPLSPPDEAPVG